MNGYRFLKLLWIIFRTDQPDLKKIEHMGLLAVKIGQLYALRIDFLNPQKCQHLSQLYRQNTPLSSGGFKDLYDRYAPEALKKNLKSLQEEPLATASVGQVHRAELTNGDQVVIKIIKTDAKDQFLKDVKRLKRFARFILFFYPKLKKVADPLGTLEQIEKDTLAELDLHNEIKGSEKLKEIANKYAKTFDLSELSFMTFYPEYSNENVLVSRFSAGKTLDEELSEGRLDYKDLLKLFRVHGLYLFIEGTFHGDIHPGNIILEEGKLMFLDTSSIGTVEPRFGRLLLEMFEEMRVSNFAGCAAKLQEMSDIKLSEKAYQKFEAAFLDLYSDFRHKTVSEVSLTKKMMQTVKMSVHAGMAFESGMFSVIKSLMYLDGMVIKCKPDAILLDDMEPFIEQFRQLKPH